MAWELVEGGVGVDYSVVVMVAFVEVFWVGANANIMKKKVIKKERKNYQ